MTRPNGGFERDYNDRLGVCHRTSWRAPLNSRLAFLSLLFNKNFHTGLANPLQIFNPVRTKNKTEEVGNQIVQLPTVFKVAEFGAIGTRCILPFDCACLHFAISIHRLVAMATSAFLLQIHPAVAARQSAISDDEITLSRLHNHTPYLLSRMSWQRSLGSISWDSYKPAGISAHFRIVASRVLRNNRAAPNNSFQRRHEGLKVESFVSIAIANDRAVLQAQQQPSAGSRHRIEKRQSR